MTLLFSLLTVMGRLTEMNKIALLVLFMLFAFCSMTLADVVTTFDGSVFEGERVKSKSSERFKVAEGTVLIVDMWIISIEDRKPTADERGRLLRFKTERYDVTWESNSMTPLEVDVLSSFWDGIDQGLSDEACVKNAAEKFNLPPIIVEMIVGKAPMW